jgi:CheY-like chemotaxis protein
MDGMAATRKIRAEHPNPPPIVGLTADVLEEDIERYIEAGMVDVVTKPIDRERFEEVVGAFVYSTEPMSVKEADESEQVSAKPAPFATDVRWHDEAIFERARERLGFGESVINRLVEAFRSSVGEILDELDEAVRHESYGRLAEAAHKLKGGAATLGLDELVEIASLLEEKARAEAAFDYAGAVAALRTILCEERDK